MADAAELEASLHQLRAQEAGADVGGVAEDEDLLVRPKHLGVLEQGKVRVRGHRPDEVRAR